MNAFLMMFTVFLIVILAFTEIAKFMLVGFEFESVAQSVLMTFATLIILGGYTHAFNVLHSTLDNLGLLILRLGTGNEDVFFLSKWVNKYLYYIYGGEDSSLLTMSVGDVLFAAVWHIVSFVLQAAMYFVATWATWTLAMAKIVGILFIPCLVHPATRDLFDGWLQFTIGSLLLLVILRVAGVLVALGIKAQFEAIGLLSCGGLQSFASCTVSQRQGFNVGAHEMLEMVVAMAISILLVFAAIGISAAIAGKVSSPSKAVGKGMGKVASQIAKADLVKSFVK